MDKTRGRVNYYRPQTKLRKGNVFTSVCQQFCPREGSVHPLGRHPSLGRHPLGTSLPPPSDSHCSRRYKSYWNAFLLEIKLFEGAAGEHFDRTWRAFEFERAAWNSLGEWNYFIWKANSDDVTRGFLINIHDVGKAPQQILLSDWTDIGDVITLWDTHWWCHHFMFSGPEVFTPIFLQFSPKNKARQIRWWFLIITRSSECIFSSLKTVRSDNRKCHE